MYIFLILIVGIANFTLCQKTYNPQHLSTFMYTTAVDGVNLHSEPKLQSEVIGVLPFLTKVTILKRDEVFVTIDRITSQCFKVYADNSIGWVFAGYLSVNADIPKLKNKDFIAVYRIKYLYTEVDSFGYEDIIKRLRKSYMGIYEKTGNN